MECPLSYQEILDAYTVNRWDTGQHFCIRVTVPDGSVLLKVNTLVVLYSLWELTVFSSPLLNFDLSIGMPNSNKNHEIGNVALLNNVGTLVLFTSTELTT